MARIRTIKPEFPHSESMGRVSRDARLTFIQMWTLADDAGRLRGNSRMLASLLFPYDDDAKKLIDGWLAELEHENCIDRYSAEDTSYIQIRNWLNHQKIDKPSASKLPPFDESSRILSNPLEDSSGDLDLEGIKEGKGGESKAPAPKRTRRVPEDFSPDLEYAVAQIPDLDLAREVQKFRDWEFKTPRSDWPGVWRTWVGNARESGRYAKRNTNGAPAEFAGYTFR